MSDGNVNNDKLIEKIFTTSNRNNRIITGLVNNAGIRQRKKFLDIKKKDLNDVFQTNYLSIFRNMQIFLKKFNKKKITRIFTTSRLGINFI